MRTIQLAGFLNQFMKNSDAALPVLAELPHNLSVLYARDLICYIHVNYQLIVHQVMH